MRLLLDTHALIWWGRGDRRLGRRAATEIGRGGNEVSVSAASAMEVSTKHRLGRLPEAGVLAAQFEAEIADLGFRPLAITVEHGRIAGAMPIAHKDPFDRLLIAQAMVDGLTLVSNEARFDGFGVARLW